MPGTRRPGSLRAVSTETFQIPLEVAESYEANFVPQLFAGLAPPLLDAARLRPGQRVLDVCCGTGIVARPAADRIGTTARIVGLDRNAAMLTVARRVRPELEWRQGDAQALPFGDGEFDVVTCQSGLMFVPDAPKAVREMARVLASGGTLAVQLWSAPNRQPGFRPMADAVARHAGPASVELISSYFRLGEPAEFAEMCRAAGLADPATSRNPVTLRAGSIDDYVTTEVESTPLVSQISDEVYGKIRADAHVGLAPYCDDAGRLAIPMEVYFVTARRP
jgi:ubiquinone/menaquinone biosynthesis C-methylase UbiE